MFSFQHTDLSLRETFSRRIRTLGYVKRCLSITSQSTQGPGAAHVPAWLDTVKLSKRDLEAVYESGKMKRRTNRNHILGCSIAPTLDYNSSTEFARALLALFNEVETMSEGGDKDRAKMVSQFEIVAVFKSWLLTGFRTSCICSVISSSPQCEAQEGV
jgi:hypothetical protein